MSDFFDAVRPFILAPSATILDFWRASGKYQHLGSAVVPPCDLMQTNITPQFQSGRALRVAFLGAPTYEKGWDAFESLVRWHSQDPRYEFFHFSWAPADVPGLRKVPVTVTRSNRMAMVDAVREAGIDVVINWSLCFESFSFTAHEALAAGTYLIARRGSGHVERVVAESDGNGCIVGSDIELHAMFATDEVIAKLASSARRCAVLQPGIGAGSILREVWAGERKHA
ncbi:hypothetical protein CAL14_19675 [Bordetella genomosp. 9]|nr:hypothetical protein CAL14_19675 [Bordetella genomosp. 9]